MKFTPILTYHTGRGRSICTSATAAGGGSCWPGVKTIAHDLHLSPRTVQRALNDLERAGYIQRQRRHRENGSCTSNLYIINEVK